MVCLDPGSMGLVLEWVEGPALSHLLHTQKVHLPHERKLSILKDVLSGLSYMHQHRHTHLDVKSDNVLLCGEQGVAKLSDFGTSKEQRMTVMDTDVALTITHSAPEILSIPRQISLAADLWSVGMLLYEMESNARPFAGVSIADASIAIKGGRVPELRDECNLLFRELYTQCLSFQPAQRPSCKDLLARVKEQLQVQCIACLDEKMLSEGVRCSGAKREFMCFGCLPHMMESVRIAQSDGVECTSCGGSYALHEMHQHLPRATFKRWMERREEQRTAALEQQLRVEKGKLRLEALAFADTKECPHCFLRWGEPVHCRHVTCHSELSGCGGEWCWECRCDYRRIRIEGNTAHAPECKFHSGNL